MTPTPDTQSSTSSTSNASKQGGAARSNMGKPQNQESSASGMNKNSGDSEFKNTSSKTSPGSNADESLFSSAKEKVSAMGTMAGDKVSDVKENLASRLGSVASSIRSHAGDTGKFSSTVKNVATGIESAGEYIKNTDVRDIGKDVATVVRKYPIYALVAGLSVGLLVGRAFKRSSV